VPDTDEDQGASDQAALDEPSAGGGPRPRRRDRARPHADVFEADATPIVEIPHRATADIDTACAQLGSYLFECQVRLPVNQP
jgi:hypothetical protein